MKRMLGSTRTLDLDDMRTIIEFTYYSVFTVIPDGATLGKARGAATLHSSMFSIFYFAIFLWVTVIIVPIQMKPVVIASVVALIFGGHFVFNWRYFLNDEKQEYLAEEYGHLKKWKLKLIGVSFLLFCFFFFIFSGIMMGILRQ